MAADWSDFGLLGRKVPKMGDSLLRTPKKHRAKFDAASFIIGGEIRNRTNKHKHTHADKNKQTVTDISTHADVTFTCRVYVRISSVTFTSTHLYGNVYMRNMPVGVARALADLSDFGLLGKQSSLKNLLYPALDADKPPCKM